MPLPNLIALAVMLVVFVVVFGPRFLRWRASHKGSLEVAVVKSAELTAVMDERKQYFHRLVLEVTPSDGAPAFTAAFTQVLPFATGGRSPSPGSQLHVRVLGKTVHVIGHAPSAGALHGSP